jgi:hypothetical protein
MNKKNPSLPEIKKHLKAQSADQLVALLMECYKLSPDVKNYIHVMIDPEGTVAALHKKSKETIIQEFYPERGVPKLRYAVAKKAISDFNKYNTDISLTLDLMITYVEQGVEFTRDYGDIDERFYNTMISMYKNVMRTISKSGDLGPFLKYKDRLEKIVKDADGTGWWFGEELAQIYHEVATEYDQMED